MPKRFVVPRVSAKEFEESVPGGSLRYRENQLEEVIFGGSLISMGAVGALAPTVFESMGASTHGFLATILISPSIFKML